MASKPTHHPETQDEPIVLFFNSLLAAGECDWLPRVSSENNIRGPSLSQGVNTMTPDQLAALLTAAGWGAYVPAFLALVGLAAKIAAVAPPATVNSSAAWRVTRALLDVLGGNWGNARNAAP
jgi:hypothetical protein